MEPKDLNRESFKQCRQCRNYEMLGDPFDGEHDLKLSHFIDRIDVIESLFPVLISLVNGVDTDKSRLALRVWLAADSDHLFCRAGFLMNDPNLPIFRAFAQIVQMGNRDPRQSFKTFVSEAMPGALTKLFDRWPRGGTIQSVYLRQQADIFHRVV